MNFEYYGIGKIAGEAKNATLLQLATNIVTDWMPGTPNSLSHGFSDLLASTIKGERLFSSDKKNWIIQPEVDLFEKQWKQITSWILGVAFCRKVIETEGYQFWAPVSAFTSAKRKTKVAVSYWKSFFDETQCVIDPVPLSGSNLLPDYVLGRINPITGSREISFAESKGNKISITNLSVPPISWRNQSKNAQFIFRKVPYAATQNFVIATRVNPKGVYAKTRKIQVRAWNSRNPENEVPDSVFRVILMMHYYGVCRRIGMEANAELIVLSNLIRTLVERLEVQNQDFDQVTLKRTIDNLHAEIDALSDQASAEIQELPILSNTNLVMYGNSNRPAFPLGDRQMRVGLNQIAIDAIKWLQGDYHDFSIDLLFKEGIRNSTDESQLSEEMDFYVRNDGVVSNWV